jgi:hypothetical protein
MDLIAQFNRYAGENKSLLQKALTSAVNVGEALIPQHLEQVITNAIPRLSPTVAMMTPKFDNQKLHEFNRLVTLPGIGGAMGESAVTPTTQPLFHRANVTMKVVRRKGATTNFLQDSSKKNIDAAAANIEAELLQHVYDLEHYIVYGNATINSYEFSGWDHFISTNRIEKSAGGVVPASLADLDTCIDENLERQGEAHKKAFVMSAKMLSKFSQLLTNVRLNQGMGQVNIEGGWRLNAYRDIPIIVSSACRPKATMGVVTPTYADSGGTILDNTTRYSRVSYASINGEEMPCAEISQNVGSAGAGNVHTIVLSWTAVTSAYMYKIYVGTSSGDANLHLRHIIPGFTYDANGTIAGTTTTTVAGVKNWTSDANGNVNTCTFLADPNTAGTEVSTAMQSDHALIPTGGVAPETVWFIDLDEFQGLGRLPYTNAGGSRFNGLVTISDLAITDDFLPFLIKSYCAVADCFEASSSLIRGLRIA